MKEFESYEKSHEAGFYAGVKAQENGSYRAKTCMDLFPFYERSKHKHFKSFVEGWRDSIK